MDNANVRKSKELKDNKECRGIFLSPDRTLQEQDQRRKLVSELENPMLSEIML